MQISEVIDVKVISDPFEVGWDALTAIFTGVMMLTAIVALFIAAREYFSKTKPFLSIVSKDIVERNKQKKAILKNSSDRTVYQINAVGNLDNFYQKILYPGDTCEIKYRYGNFSDLNLTYSRYPEHSLWSSVLSLLDFGKKKIVRRKDLNCITSFNGRIRLRKLLREAVLKARDGGEIEFVVLEKSSFQTKLKVRLKDSDGCLLKSSVLFASSFEIVAYMVSNLLDVECMVNPNILANRRLKFDKFGSDLNRHIKASLSLYRMLLPARPESEYVSRIKASKWLSSAGVGSIKDDTKIVRSRNKGSRNILFIENELIDEEKISLLNKYRVEDQISFIIAESRLHYAAASKLETHSSGLTILDKESRIIYSSEYPEINGSKLSQQQLNEFTSAFRELKNTSPVKSKRHVRLRTILRMKIENTIAAILWRPVFS